MDLINIQDNYVGEWSGKNLLRLSWLNPSDHFSASNLIVTTITKGKFLSFTYTWEYENVSQEGLIIVGYDSKEEVATAVYIDSWHMSSKVMSCQGTISQQGIIELRGAYQVPSSPDWGWKIVISVSSDEELQIEMYNCSPEGEEDLAVRAEYKRVLQ